MPTLSLIIPPAISSEMISIRNKAGWVAFFKQVISDELRAKRNSVAAAATPPVVDPTAEVAPITGDIA